MSKLATTVHEIHRNGEKPLPIARTFEFDEKEFAELKKLGAIREPNDAEAQIYEAEKARTEAASKAVGSKKAAGKADAKTEAKTEAKADAKTEAKAEAKADAKADGNSEVGEL